MAMLYKCDLCRETRDGMPLHHATVTDDNGFSVVLDLCPNCCNKVMMPFTVADVTAIKKVMIT